jgi:hypothetical protein
MRSWNTAIVSLLGFLTAVACTPTRRITVPPTQTAGGQGVAIVKTDWETLGMKLSIERIDGVQVREFSWWQMPSITEAKLPAGPHTVEVSFDVDTWTRSTSNAVVRFEAQPNRAYQIHAAQIPEGFWSEVGKAVIGGRGSWTAWVVDTSSGQVVGGRKLPDAH